MGTAATQVIKSRPADQKIFQNRKKVKDTEYPVGASSLTFFLFWIDYFSFNRDGFLLFRNEIQFWLLTKLILRYFCQFLIFEKSKNVKAHLLISPKTRNECVLHSHTNNKILRLDLAKIFWKRNLSQNDQKSILPPLKLIFDFSIF